MLHEEIKIKAWRLYTAPNRPNSIIHDDDDDDDDMMFLMIKVKIK
jgi:hypothetical protein